MRSYWEQFIGEDESFWHGLKAGIRAFAWWKNGVQYVGTTGLTLREVFEEIEQFEYESAKKRVEGDK